MDKDKDLTTFLSNIVYKEINEKLTKLPCSESKLPISFPDVDFMESILERDRTLSVYSIEHGLKNLKILFDNNPKLKIKATKDGFLLNQPPVTYYCFFVNNVLFAMNWMYKIFILLTACWLGYQGLKWKMKKQAQHREEVFKLIGNIVEIVSSKSQGPESFIPISHVRDQLIPPQDRSKKAKLWKDALILLESDSRLRREVQEVEGEEFMVWRWLAATLSPKRKMWQGQAFGTFEGSVNTLSHSPTSCLKIRHMFEPEQEEGDEWVTTVVDAILEKCGTAKILHVVVDKQSKEGCVYIKCASTLDAGLAFRSLHGSWFDSKLVTVKYIREPRYLERFPDSVTCVEPLRPSNESKNSLQWTLKN